MDEITGKKLLKSVDLFKGKKKFEIFFSNNYSKTANGKKILILISEN